MVAQRRILVTGGEGFIGQHLVKALRDEGQKVVVVDNQSRKGFPYSQQSDAICGDISDWMHMERIFREVEPKVVYNLGAVSSVGEAEKNPQRCFQSNVDGVRNLAELCLHYGATLVQASSREVYGNQDVLPVSESAAMSSPNRYGSSKIRAEKVLTNFKSRGLQGRVLRFANVVGQGDHPPRVVPSFLKAATQGKPLSVNGGTQLIDFVSVGVAVLALLRCADRPDYGPINIGSGKAIRLIDLAMDVAQHFGVDLIVHPPVGYEVKGFEADVTKMRRHLGIFPPRDPIEVISLQYQPVLERVASL